MSWHFADCSPKIGQMRPRDPLFMADFQSSERLEPSDKLPSRAAELRRELSYRNLQRAAAFAHEVTYGFVPSVVYTEAEQGGHGNFLPASYRRICASPDWMARLAKAYTASRSVPRSGDRRRSELDCANSSDALLMNVFCYPGVLRRAQLCSLLGIEKGERPQFGFRPLLPLKKAHIDRTEIDMKVGDLLVESKLTESGFQQAREQLVVRYVDFAAVFQVGMLPRANGKYCSYQLVRGVLAAAFHCCSFCVLCDARRPELIESWFQVMSAVRDAELRSRLKIITWEELATTLPGRLQEFLREKYGIEAALVSGWKNP